MQVFGHRQGLAAVLDASGALRPDLRVLDAGCGTGLSIIALNDALRRRGLSHASVEGFDLTPAMLDRCRSVIQAAGVPRVELRQADVLRLGAQLPSSWQDYDLITCVSVLEHMPRGQLTAAPHCTARTARPERLPDRRGHPRTFLGHPLGLAMRGVQPDGHPFCPQDRRPGRHNVPSLSVDPRLTQCC